MHWGLLYSLVTPSRDESRTVFFFFSNRLGCLGSILVSVVVTGLILLVLRLL